MSVWSGLLKKEIRLGRVFVLVAFLAMLFYLGLAIYSTMKTEHGGVLFGFASALVVAHILYLPVYVGVSLRQEQQTMHLWLHNPASGVYLLGAKWLAGFIALCCSLFIACLITLYAGYLHDPKPLKQTIFTTNDVLIIGVATVMHVILISSFLATLVIFFMVINLVLKTKLGKLRWLLFGMVILFGPRLWSRFEGTNIYAFLTKWGPISLPDSLQFASEVIYIGTYLFYILLSVILFYISAWLVDKKVEV